MPRTLGNIIADSLAAGVGYAERLQAGLEPATFARLAAPGGQVIQSNHPSFVYGHLSLYPARIFDNLGGDVGSVMPGDPFQQVYDHTAQCQDDPDGTIYPPMDEVLSAFFTGYQAAIERLRATSDDVFQQPNPLERMAERFPTIGSMHNFYCGGHLMIHMGQLSAWRRMMGLSAA